MNDVEKVINDLEEQVAWIRDNEFHKLPGWGHAVLAMKDAIALLKAQEPRVLSVADIIDLGIVPDVIWIERREEGDVVAGVWQIDHYEMVGGGIVDDLGEEIAEAPEAYNTKWRCWDKEPTDEQRRTTPWKN